MQAINRHFAQIINGTTQFVIPVFQRDYSWDEAQCEQLWDDIVRVGRQDTDRAHFMGSLVYIPSGDTAAGFTRWLLIDGQQRMTTLMLLLLALRQYLEEYDWQTTGEDSPTAKRIDAYFLKNLQEDGERQYKLVLRREDQKALRALLDGSDPPPRRSRVVENFEFFRERFADDGDPAIVYRGIGRLMVVDVTLDRANDDPQMIFESLNSTGLDLSQADLIRNFILMSVQEPEQTRLYESYWHKIEDAFRGAGQVFDSFARDYMALHTRASKQARSSEIYHGFRAFFRERDEKIGKEVALQQMQRFARYHAAFSLRRAVSTPLDRALARLNRLAEVCAILVMRLYDCHDRAGTLTESEFVEALGLLESYVFRRSVCGMESRGYWQVFASIAHGLIEAKPLESLKVLLHRQRESYRFPRDAEFHDELTRRDIYSMRTVHYLLDRLENYDSKEPTDTSSYTVEHVLPQIENLKTTWQKMLGDDWRAVQQAHVHRLGNLTLTGYNSTYSDRSFEEKKTIAGGFDESSVRLNKFIREQKQWTAKEIEKRGSLLAKRATQIWPALTVDPEALKVAAQVALQTRAERRTVSEVAMTPRAREILEALRPLIKALNPGMFEVAEWKSIAYHAADGDFFCEVLPRKHRLTLLLNIDLNECQYQDDNVVSAADYKFLVHAQQSGGVLYKLWSTEQLEGAMKLVRQAYEIAAE